MKNQPCLECKAPTNKFDGIVVSFGDDGEAVVLCPTCGAEKGY
jgi:hypothetical protein